MPGLDRRLDPVTRDYIDDGAGGYAETRTIEPAVVHQTLDAYGEDPGDPQAGSRVRALLAGSNGPAQIPEARNAVAVGLQPLISAGLARDVAIRVERDGARLLIETDITDANAGTEPEDLHLVVPLE